MIKRAPLKRDPPGTCSRWWVKIYNAGTRKAEIYTVRGTLKDAEALERERKMSVGYKLRRPIGASDQVLVPLPDGRWLALTHAAFVEALAAGTEAIAVVPGNGANGNGGEQL